MKRSLLEDLRNEIIYYADGVEVATMVKWKCYILLLLAIAALLIWIIISYIPALLRNDDGSNKRCYGEYCCFTEEVYDGFFD